MNFLIWYIYPAMTKYTLLLALVLTIFSLDLSCALNVSYDSNEVVSTGYTYKSFFLNSEFDRDVFVTPQCQTGPAGESSFFVLSCSFSKEKHICINQVGMCLRGLTVVIYS